MIEALALFIVILSGVYLVALAVVSLLSPGLAIRFLLSFAGTPFAHYLELSLRFVIGGSLVVSAPKMIASGIVGLFGWVMLITTIGLSFLPWRWHQRFAQQAVPRATRYITFIGLCSFTLGMSVLAAVILGSAT